jgi:predicted outer membrane repeat protein
MTDDMGNKIKDIRLQFVVNEGLPFDSVYDDESDLYVYEDYALSDERIYVVSASYPDPKNIKTAIIRNINGTFTDLQNQIDACDGVLDLPYNFTFNSETDENFTGGVVINKTLTINGNGMTINGSSSARVFNVTDGNVVLNDVTFTNSGSIYAGVIYFAGEGNLTLDNSVFTGNSALAVGVILFNGQNLEIIDSQFINNIAMMDSVIYAKGNENLPEGVRSKVTITNSTFNNNTSLMMGTVILENVDSEISDSTFTDSMAKYGIYNINGTLSLSKNTVSSAIYNNGTIATKVNATVLENKTIIVEDDVYNLTATYVDDNNNKIYDPNARFTINGVAYDVAPSWEDGVYIVEYPITVDAYYYTVGLSNVSEDYLYTGVIRTVKGTFTDLARQMAAGDTVELKYNITYDEEIDDPEYANGIAMNDSSIGHDVTIIGNGYTISGSNVARVFTVYEYTLTLENLTICDANYNDIAGVARVYSGATLKANEVTFENNSAISNAGVIFSEGTVIIENSHFNNNSVIDSSHSGPIHTNFGGAIVSQGGSLTISSSDFTSNYFKDVVLNYGGAIYVDGSILNLTGVRFVENVGRSDGGALYIRNVQDGLVEDCEFYNNSAAHGGAICILNSEITINDSNFTKNNAERGGAIYVDGADSVAVIDFALFNANNASDIGGAIYNAGFADVASSSFLENEATVEGSSIYNNYKLYLENNTVSDYIYNNAMIMSDVNATFLGNEENNTIVAALYDEVNPYGILTDDVGNAIYDPLFNISVHGNVLKTTFDKVNKVYNATYIIANAGDNIVTASAYFTPTNLTEGKYDVPKANITEFLVVPGGQENRIPYGENVTIYVSLYGVDYEGLNETITVVVNETPYTVKITNGTGSFNVSGLDPEEYGAFGIFDGNDNYNGAYAEGLFCVLCPETTLNVTFDNIFYGEDAVINISLTDYKGPLFGTIVITINGTDTVIITEGNSSVAIKGLPVGEYLVNVTYIGDNLHQQLSNDTQNITVFDDPEVEISADVVSISYYGDNLTIEIDPVYTADGLRIVKGNVTIKAYETFSSSEPIDIGTFEVGEDGLNVSDVILPAGVYNIVIEFLSEDGYYYGRTIIQTTVNVKEIDIIVQPLNVTYGNNVIIVEWALGINDEPLNGTIYYAVSGLKDVNGSFNITNSYGYIEIEHDFAAGSYTFESIFIDADGNYYGEAITPFEVYKATPTVEVNNTTAEWGKSFVIPVKLIGINGTPITEKLTVKVDMEKAGAVYYVVDLNGSGEGDAEFTIIHALGEMDIIVTFEGNENYTDAEANATLTIIDDMTAVLDVVADSTVPYGETVYVNVTLTNIREVPIANVNITYRVDDGEAQNATTGEDGFVSIPITGLAGGEHTITVTFNNESYHDVPKVDDVTVKVTPIEPTFKVNVSKGNVYGNNVTITVASELIGNVTLFINNEKVQVEVPLEDGNYTFEVPGLAAGTYTGIVLFNGNENYTAAGSFGSFEVAKATPTLEVNNTTAEWGVPFEIPVKLIGVDGTPIVGTVNVEIAWIGGVAYDVVTLDDNGEGIANFNLTGPIGQMGITASFAGNDNYTEAIGAATLNVTECMTPVLDVVADNVVPYDEIVYVNVTLTNIREVPIANVNITYSVDGGVAQNKTTDENGFVSIPITGLAGGEHTITVSFNNESYHEVPKVEDVTVKVTPIEPTFKVKVSEGNVYGNNVTITVTSELIGNLTLIINNEEVQFEVPLEDGNYTFEVPGLAAGTNTAIILFNGNENYTEAGSFGSFEVAKATPTVEVDNTTAEWGVPFEIPVKLIGVDGTPIVGTVNVEIVWMGVVEYYVVTLDDNGEGVAELIFDGIPGEWTITASFSGNDNYTNASSTAILNITECMKPVLDVVADSTVPYDNIVYVNVTLENRRGAPIANVNITYSVDGGEAQSEITGENGFVSIPITGLAGGVHTVTVSFNNESYYPIPSENVTVTVTPIEPKIFVSGASEDNVYGNNVSIYVLAPGLIGNVSLTVDNVLFNPGEALENGIYIFNVTDLAAGTHSYVVTFSGNENFTKKSDGKSFVVAKATPVLDVNDTVVVYDEIIEIPFAVIGVNGQYVNGSVYAIQFETEEYGAVEYFDDGTGTIAFRDLATGIQKITVKFASDNDNYTNVVKDIYLNVTQATITNLSAANERDFTYGDPIDIIVYVEGLVGDDDIEVCLNITDINGISVFEDYFPVKDGDVITVYDILPVGEYNYDITFAGDDTYVPGEKGGLVSGVFYVDPINITDIVTIDGSEITYGENGTITVSDIPEDAKGNITVTLIGVNGKFIADVEDGYAVVEIPGLNGNHIYYVESIVYSGDEIYAPFTIEDNDIAIEVERASSEIYILPVSDTTHLGNTSFTFFVVNATTVFVTVVSSEREIIYEENITEIPANGIVYKTVNLTNVPAGKYTILVFNNWTDNYKAAFEYVSFVSERISPEMETSITPDIKVEDEGVQISITLPVDANGTVSVLIDGNVISLGGKQTDGNLTVNVPADKLTFGPHSYTVQFSGDSYYLAEDVTLPFSVTKIDQPVSVIIDEEEIGFMGSPVVNISVASDATGRIFIDVNGEYTVFENLTEGGNYTIQIVDLQAGEFYLNVTYMGDRKYNEANNYTTFTVPKAVAAVNITDNPTFITYGDDLTFTVTMTNNFATGNVTIFINDVANATVFLDEDDANASVAISGLTVGNYEIGVKYNGNDNFVESDTVKFLLSVNKADSSVVIDEIQNVTYGSDVVITYSVVNRTNVTVTFAIYNGTGFEDINASNELFEDHIVVHDLASGIYIVYINNNESESYRNSKASMVFFVNPAEPVINITVETAYYTSDVNVSYSIDPAFLGYEIFVYDDNATLISHTDVDNTIVLSNLTTGYYNITVYAYYNENYTDGYSTARFYVSIMDINPPANTSDTVFSITMPENATGLLLVDIDGQHYFAPLVNGTASITVPQLVPGNYTANVTYTGDENYPGFSTTQNVTVESNVPDSAFTIPDSAKSDAPTTYSIKLDENATGYLEVDVDGTKYVGALNKGQASVTIPALSAGDHNVTVKYTGDNKNTPVVKETKLSVTEPVFKITNNKNVAAVYSAKANYKVRVLREGKAVGAGVTVTFKFNGKTYTAKTDAKGYATLKLNTKVKVGKYTITATYKGVTVKNTVTIKQLIKAKKAKIKKSKKVNKIKVKTKKVNGKYLKGKKLKLKITKASKSKKKSSGQASASSSAKKSTGKSKVKYIKAKINKKGVAIFKLKKSVTKKLKAGKKYKYTVIYGKDTITKKLTVKK